MQSRRPQRYHRPSSHRHVEQEYDPRPIRPPPRYTNEDGGVYDERFVGAREPLYTERRPVVDYESTNQHPYARREHQRYVRQRPAVRFSAQEVDADVDDDDYDEDYEEGGYPEQEFGGTVLDAVGIVRDGDEGDEEYDAYKDYPEPPPDDAWSRQEPPQRRELLSDYVSKYDPRNRDEWDPDQGYIVDFGAEDEGEGGEEEKDKSSFIDADRLAQNLDGLFDMDDINQDELRRAMEYNSRSVFRIPNNVADILYKRFKRSEHRAIRGEQHKANGQRWLVPSLSAQQWSSNKTRIGRVFDVHTRVRDMTRALDFYALQPETLEELTKSIAAATKAGRRQYADYIQDLLTRVRIRMRQKQAATAAKMTQGGSLSRTSPPLTTTNTPLGNQPRGLGKRVATRPRVGRVAPSGSLGPRRRGVGGNRGISALEVPVFSRACWVMTPPPTSGDAASLKQKKTSSPPSSSGQYYGRGNDHFLSSRLGLVSASSRLAVEQDAIRFFAKRFGLDFSTKAGAKKDEKNGTITHATLPAVLEPYTVSASLDAQIQLAEGHLASTMTKTVDPLGNGVRLYNKDGDGPRTTVAEVGWMVRTTSKEGLVLPGPKTSAKVQSTRMLPRGGILATGYWLVRRPEASPTLLRFQSSGPPTVSTQILKANPGRRQPEASVAAENRGIRHEITSRWDVYDMGHDTSARPYKGTGRGVSVVRIDRMREGPSTQESRTMVTIHH